MFKQFVIALGALVAATAFAAVDVNKASQAELESIKGIGPTNLHADPRRTAEGSVQGLERPDHADQGVGEASAGKFSQNGLTVNGTAFAGPTSGGAAPATSVTPAKGKKKNADAAAGMPAKK